MMLKDYDYSGKVVLVAGASGRLGIEICKAFLNTKAILVATYHSDESLHRLQTKLGKSLQDVFLLRGDFKKEEDVKTLLSEILKKYGEIDVFVNAIGGYIAGKPVTEIDQKEWDEMMDLNLKSAFLLGKHIVKNMIKQGEGKVIYVGARPGLQAGGFDAAYAASKSGLVRLVESLSEEVKSKGINVNCVLPSIIDTEKNRSAMSEADYDTWVKPEDLARTILFLASEDARQIHGASIPVYGLV